VNRESLVSGLLVIAALVAAGVAVQLVLVADAPNLAAVGLALLGANFFAASAAPRVRHHEAYGLLSATYAVAAVGLWGLVAGPGISLLPLVFGVVAVGWLVVELLKRRDAGRPSAN